MHGNGRIDAVVQSRVVAERLSNGVLIRCIVRAWGSTQTISHVELVQVPNCALPDLFFLHHVLEICYYFLPLNQESDDIVDLVQLLYSMPELFKECGAQKVFLSKLFQRMGLYPHERTSLILPPNDSSVVGGGAELLTQSGCKQLKRWLLECISSHPYGYRLKTVDFLKKLDVHE